MILPFNNLAGVDLKERKIKVVLEIPKGSLEKIEWDRHQGLFVLDRILPNIFKLPENYGFIPQTLDEDGDELDVLFISEQKLTSGLLIDQVRVLAVLRFIDGGEADHKIIACHSDDYQTKHLKSLKDIPQSRLSQIEHYYNHYKDLAKKVTKTNGFGRP